MTDAEDHREDEGNDGGDRGNADRLFPETETVDDPSAIEDRTPPGEPPMDDVDRPAGAPNSGSGQIADDDLGGSAPDGPGSPEAGSASGGPLGDLADRMRENADRVEGGDDVFEAVDVGTVDQETLWKQVASDEEFVVEGPGDREDVVDKSTYCETCEFFAGPPEVRCTHEGTSIRELVDLEHFRVRNCPVVIEEEALENIND
ncbi:MAG: hypothetical protein V5A33_00590 [Halobacteriales archaeon]